MYSFKELYFTSVKPFSIRLKSALLPGAIYSLIIITLDSFRSVFIIYEKQWLDFHFFWPMNFTEFYWFLY